jgi:hypothetical protein
MLIGQLVMDAVIDYPVQRAMLQGQGSTDCQAVFQEPGNSVTTVGKQTVIAYADAQADAGIPKHGRNGESLPGKEEKRQYRAQVKQGHKGDREPVQRLFLDFAAERVSLVRLYLRAH